MERRDTAFDRCHAFCLIVLSSSALQLGIARSLALVVNVISVLGPAFVFLAHQFVDRLAFSGPTLACIALFSVSAGVAIGLRTSEDLCGRS